MRLIIIAPNTSDKPNVSYNCWDWKKAAELAIQSGHAAFCIARPRPMRLYSYSVRYGTPAAPDSVGELETGQWFSWRTKALREFAKMNANNAT